MKREHEPSLEGAERGTVATTHTVDAADALPQRKRQRCAAALTTEVKTEVKEEDIDMILQESALAAKPEPGVKPESEAKVEAKLEPRSSAVGLSRTPAMRGRAAATERSPPACPPPAPVLREARSRGGSQGPSRAVKAVRLGKWKAWCNARKWICQHDPGYKQKDGDVVAHRSDAKSYYRFEDYEIDTIPYVSFPNKHNPNSFGRSYNNVNLRTLVSRKWAYLAGLDEQEQFNPETKEVEFLKEGWKLFDAATKQLEEKMRKANKTRKPLKLWRIRTIHTFNSSMSFEFEPLENEFADFYAGYERSWPRGADWAWELGGLCSCCDGGL